MIFICYAFTLMIVILLNQNILWLATKTLKFILKSGLVIFYPITVEKVPIVSKSNFFGIVCRGTLGRCALAPRQHGRVQNKTINSEPAPLVVGRAPLCLCLPVQPK